MNSQLFLFSKTTGNSRVKNKIFHQNHYLNLNTDYCNHSEKYFSDVWSKTEKLDFLGVVVSTELKWIPESKTWFETLSTSFQFTWESSFPLLSWYLSHISIWGFLQSNLASGHICDYHAEISGLELFCYQDEC